MTRDYIKYRSGYKYQLADDYEEDITIYPDENIETDFISLTTAGLLTVKRGYAWDGPSGPTFDTKDFMRGSLVHDALYQLMRENELKEENREEDREEADRILGRICIEDGMSELRVWSVYLGVRGFADFAAAPENKKEIEFAP